MSVAPQANQPNVDPAALPGLPPAPTRAGIEAEIAAELAGSIAPLEAEAESFQRASDRAIEDLNALFGGIMPFVAGSADRVAQVYGATNQAQASIFNQAWQRLNALRSERAAEAQALAQQIGAPIPIDQFTGSVDLERSVFVPEAAGELLKASSIGQAGVQEAQAFAGRVFPLQKTRLHSETRNFYNEQIAGLKKQIASLRSMKPGLVNERLRERQLQQYEMQLARSEAAFQRYTTKRSLSLEEKRLKAQLEEIRGSQALTARGQDIQVQEAAKDRRLREKLSKQERQLGNRTYVNQQKQNIVEATNALASGTTQTVDRKRARWTYVDAVTGEEIAPGTKGGKWELQTWTETVDVGGQSIRNPNRLLNVVMARLGIRRGQTELYNFAVAQVIQTLRTMGIRNIPGDPSKWDKWWREREDRLRRRAREGMSGTGPVNPPSEAPGGPKR